MHVNVASVPTTQNNNFGNNNRGGFYPSMNGFVNRGGGRGRGRSYNKIVYCQLCRKLGHFVDRCYHRFDKNFQCMPNQGFGRGSNGNQSDFRAYMASFSDSNGAYMNDTGSIQGSHYGSPSNPNPYISNNYVSQPNFSDPTWFVDSGITKHITSNLNNLSLHSPYTGGDKVAISNGKQLPITHIGTSYLETKPSSNVVLPYLKFCMFQAWRKI